MSIATLSPGLMILRQGSSAEYIRQTEKGHWFETQNTGDYFCLTDAQFFEEQARQEILVMNAITTPTRIEFEDDCPEETSPVNHTIAIGALENKYQVELDRTVDYVTKILALGITRGQLNLIRDAARRIAKERGDKKVPSAPTISLWMRSYETGNKDVTRLLTKHRNRKKTKRITDENEKLIRDAINQALYEEGKRDSAVAKKYRDLVKAENNKRKVSGAEQIIRVSDRTVIRRIADEPAFDVDVARLGLQEANRKYRMMKGHLPSSYALEVAEIDHTQVNLYVLDDQLFLPLGLPWITIIRDRFTGAILGIYISFRKTSLQSIFGAIRHSLFAHTKIQTLWPDIQNPWFSYGIATIYDSDGGADFISPRYRITLHGFGADTRYSARGTPWHKAPIERSAGECSNFVETLPGHNFPFHKTPHGYDARKHAVIRFSSLCYLLHKWICDDYHVRPHSRKMASPMERWQESISQMPIPIPPSPDSLNVMMGDIMTGTLRHDGIQYKNLTYVGEALNAIQKRIGVNQKVSFVPNPNDMGYMHVLEPGSNTPQRIQCAQFEYASGKTLHQHEYLCRLARANHNMRNGQIEQTLLETEQQIQNEISEALNAKQNADKIRIWKLALQAGVNSNDVLDGSPRSVADLLKRNRSTSRANSTGGNQNSVDEKDIFLDVKRFGWGI